MEKRILSQDILSPTQSIQHKRPRDDWKRKASFEALKTKQKKTQRTPLWHFD
jgi:hypothetical protein